MDFIVLAASDVTRFGVWLLILAAIVICVLVFKYGWLWIQALASGAHVSLTKLIGMSLRRVSPRLMVQCKVMVVKAGLPIETDALEAHYLAGGDVIRVTKSLIAASKAAIELSWDRACAIDLAGRNVFEAVQWSVNPKVIDCPDPAKGRQTIDGVAMDGIQLKAKARVTVRANIDRLVGGATEETVIARVGEGIVTAIGSAETHKKVLESPDVISKTVLQKGLDAGTAFEILSIDIADVDVGDNIGAKLQTDQAEADLKVARAKAEERRALANAKEQENRAMVVENEAKVKLAEAEIPRAIAQAFREGNLGIMDYYHLKNIQADTTMRDSIGKVSPESGRKE